MENENPLTIVYDALWSLLEANQEFTSLVKAGNRIKNLALAKDTVSPADLTEVRIVETTTDMQGYATSSSSKLIRRYSIQVSTGDQNYATGVHLIDWAIFTALIDWPTTCSALTWKDKAFIKRVSVLSSEEGISNYDLNRNVKGWASVWACEIEMWFSTSDLKQGVQDGSD